MGNIPPAELVFLVMSVAAAPVGAAWLIKEAKSPRRRRLPATGPSPSPADTRAREVGDHIA
jgi:hypothetical protein